MKKMLSVLAAVAFLATAAFAQEAGSAPAAGGSSFQIAPEFGISYWIADDPYDDMGLGFPAITVKFLYNLNNVQIAGGPLAVGAWVGYIHDYSDEVSVYGYDEEISIYTIPLVVMGELRLMDGRLLLDAGLGFALLCASVEMDIPGYGSRESSDSETKLALLLRAGYDIVQAGPGVVQASGGIFFVDDASKLMLQVGYNFAL